MILFELFITFFKIGLFTFGGGYAMLPLIQDEVAAHNWIAQEDLINFIAVSESTPGPFAINMATYIGTQMGGLLGGICATLGVVLPSFIIILIVAKIFDKFKNNKYVKGCMSGLKPGALGLIGFISDADYDVAAMLVCVFFIVGGVMLLRKAKQTQVQADNIKRYISIIVNHNVREIDAISKAMGRPYDDVKSDIQNLINNDFLKNAYINEQTGCVVLASDNVRNEAQPKADLRPRVVTCKCCGAHNTVTGDVGKCEYCDSPIQ